MRFTAAHAAGAVCVPSRYGLLTGRYPFRGTRQRTREGTVIEDGRMTVASLLRSQGYATAMVGKWHLGFEGGTNYDYAQPLRGGPIDRGFDFFFGIPASTDIPPYFYIRGDQVVTAPIVHIPANHTPGWSPVQGAFWREGLIAPGLELAEVMPTLTREASQWLASHKTSAPAQPFFLYVAFSAPHTPWLPNSHLLGRSGAGLYGDFVMQVDEAVGKLLSTLRNSGLEENTLVLFSSDNGPVWYPADRARLGHSATGILRGMKGDAWEGGHRMPFLASWPGRIAPGSTTSAVCSQTDLLATLAELVHQPLPDDAGEDSFSLLPVLLGRTGEFRRPSLVSMSSSGVLALQEGDWKLIPVLGSRGMSEPRTVEPVAGGPAGQLYHLGADPAETRNLWNDHPEVVARLSAQLETLRHTGHRFLRE